MTALAEEEERWYNKSEWTFSWGERALASAVAVDIVTESGEEPFTVFNPPVESVTFGNGELQEGLQYFILQFKENDEWGEIFEQELRIDVTPPEMTMYIEYVEDGYPHLFVEAEDGLSGVEKYTILIDGDTDQQTLSPETVVAGYKLSMLSPGEHTVVVTAYDQAGNATALREHVTVRGSVTVGTFLNNVREHIARPAEVNVVAVAFLSLMAVFGICFGLVEHHAHKRARAEARREVLAMQNKISKVFSTLRRDVLMLTTMTSKKSRVTKKEKEAVEKVTKALSASEAVIEKK
ncbi:hypothetical protein KTR10_02460 [Candidatus Kaiserbacteria bacterium]|nr:hypothetical protein [Candidatus Kaiserbacteria bacterium]